MSKKRTTKQDLSKTIKSAPLITIGNTSVDEFKTFSPSVNKNLESLIEISPNVNIYNCEDPDKIHIKYGIDKYKCVKWDSKLAETEMLKNIRASKINSDKVVAPMQVNNNCWFNCFFMIFFIDDKGRKFFRYLRETMVTGILPSKKKIPKSLHKTFFMLNRYIDGSIMGYKDTSEYALAMDTNVIIQRIGNELNKKQETEGKKQRDYSGYGNPLVFYQEIIDYLKDEPVFLLEFEGSYPNIRDLKVNKKLKIPDIIIVSLSKKESAEFKKKISLEIGEYSYMLSSIVLNDMLSSHFSAYITIDDEEYAFDGRSYNRLNSFDWSNNINKDSPMVWSSKNTDSNDFTSFSPNDTVFNFKKGYQQLFYYRV